MALGPHRCDLETLAAEIGCRTITVDLGNAAAARRLRRGPAGRSPGELRGINILEPFLEMKDESFDEVQAINVRAAAIVSQVFARDVIRRSVPAAIVNVSSISPSSRLPRPCRLLRLERALDGLTRVMANELGPTASASTP